VLFGKFFTRDGFIFSIFSEKSRKRKKEKRELPPLASAVAVH
jgi:hypothetical protein